MSRTIATMLCVGLFASGCATAGGGRMTTAPPIGLQLAEPGLVASYVKQLPIGSRVHVGLAGGRRIKGTLMKFDDRAIVIQPRARIPEPPLQIAFDRIVAVELETKNNLGKTIGAGFAAGVGGTLAVFLVLAAIFAGD
jgi:hypothetical protein